MTSPTRKTSPVDQRKTDAVEAPGGADVPSGHFDPPPRCSSHMWTRAAKYANLQWRRPKLDDESSRPTPAEADKAEPSRLVQFQVPLPTASKRSRRRPKALELCCGHAGLTAALCDSGLDATGIDWKKNKHQPTIPILNVDLTTAEGQAFIMQLLEDETMLFVHMGPPCGTFMRAHERPIPKWQQRLNAPNPQPLRSTEQPEGLSPRHLTPLDSLKVRKGNEIAEFCAKVANYCVDNGKLFSIENPTNSILWLLPCYAELVKRQGIRSVDFHACRWGSRRDKKTSFLTNMDQLECLRLQCNHKKEEHAPWGLRWDKSWQFATAEECEYPAELCQAVAKAAAQATAAPPPDRPPARRKQRSRHGPLQAAERAAVGRQSRRHPRPESVPDRKPVSEIPVPSAESAEALKQRCGPVHEPFAIGDTVVPKGAKILRVIERSPVGENGFNPPHEWTCEIALPWSDEEFFTRATKSPHPMDQEPVVPDRTKRAVFDILTKGKERWCQEKREGLQRIQQRRDALDDREQEIKQKLPEGTRKVNHKKKILLMTEMLKQIQYPDDDVAFRCCTGFPLVGTMKEVPVFEQRPETEVVQGAHTSWLGRIAKNARKTLIDKVKATPVDEILRAVYKTTTDPKEGEVKMGWAEGPYSEAKMNDIIGDEYWIAARRFGVTQKEKVRQIDDFSEYFVNACTTVADKIPVAGVDAIVNHAKLWADKIIQGREDPQHHITVTMSDGQVVEGVLHEDFRTGPIKMVGKCLDLEAAYKPCPVAPAHARFSAFALKNPTSHEVEFFLAKALPFGATAAVHGFNRAAMALNHLAHAFVGVPCTHYFDDFTIIVPETLGDAVDEMTREFFETLGWEVKVSKDKPMAERFTALGVEIDLSHLGEEDPRIVVENKAERVKEICDRIEEHLKTESMTPAEAAELRGRLVFSNSQTFGRMGALTYHYLGQKAHKSGDSSAISKDVLWSLKWWRNHVAHAKPRTVRVGRQRKPVYIFTDGSCDPDPRNPSGVRSGYGAIMYDPEDCSLETFGGYMAEPILDLLADG